MYYSLKSAFRICGAKLILYDGAMKLYLARHGRTNYNDLGLCNADPAVDVHLTAAGVAQAQTLADKLKHVPIDRIVVSELKRTQQTAERVNAFHNLKIEIDARLNDHRSGFEGKPYEALNQALNAASNRWTARFNGGESIEDVKKRAAGFLDELKTRKYDSVLVITSQWVVYAIAATVLHITNEEAWQLAVKPGGCLELEL